MSAEITKKIDALSDADLVEAAGYYLTNEFGMLSSQDIAEKISDYTTKLGGDATALENIQTELTRDRASYRQLLQFLLHDAAVGSPEQRQKIEKAIDGVGEKQVVTEVAVVVAAGLLATLVHLYYTKGVAKETFIQNEELLPNGTKRITTSSEVIYTSPSSALANFFTWLKSIPLGK